MKDTCYSETELMTSNLLNQEYAIFSATETIGVCRMYSVGIPRSHLKMVFYYERRKPRLWDKSAIYLLVIWAPEFYLAFSFMKFLCQDHLMIFCNKEACRAVLSRLWWQGAIFKPILKQQGSRTNKAAEIFPQNQHQNIHHFVRHQTVEFYLSSTDIS